MTQSLRSLFFVLAVLVFSLLVGSHASSAQSKVSEVWQYFEKTGRPDIERQTFESQQIISNDPPTSVWFATGLTKIHKDLGATRKPGIIHLAKVASGVKPDVVLDKMKGDKRPSRVYVLKGTVNEGQGDREILIVLRFYDDGKIVETHISEDNGVAQYSDYQPIAKKSVLGRFKDATTDGVKKAKEKVTKKPDNQ